MIDGQVAYDKLAQFQTADEIASYLEDFGVKAARADAHACAITVFLHQTTGDNSWYTAHVGIFNPAKQTAEGKAVFKLTTAMEDFVTKFDRGEYPNLVDPECPYSDFVAMHDNG